MLRFFKKLLEKNPPLATLSDDLLRHQLSFLNTKDTAAFLKSSSVVYRACREDYRAALILEAVAHGNQIKAEQLITQNPALLLRKGLVTDYSDRKFTDITPLQYAFWAKDTNMWRMIVKYLPADAILQQFKELDSKGTAHGKHYDFWPLIAAMDNYIQRFDTWDTDECSDYWRKIVGGLQRLTPAYVAQYYCHRASNADEKHYSLNGVDRTLYFMSARQLKTTKMHYYKSGLGEDFGIIRAFRNPMLATGKIALTLNSVRENMSALVHIAETSEHALKECISTLEIRNPTAKPS